MMLEKKIVNIGDINMAYSIIGEGDPLVLIMGYTGSMDSWSIQMLEMLSNHYKVIVFDNRGMGKSESTDEPFTIKQFADDVSKLLDKLAIEKAHILGFSMGVSIALEMVLNEPGRVNKLILFGGSCGGNEEISPDPEVMESLEDILNISMTDAQRFFRMFFPEVFIQQHRDIHKFMPVPEVIPTQENINKQFQALINWDGVYNRLSEIDKSTLVITGKDDIIRPPQNATLLANKISDAWLIKVEGGHGLMWQSPQKLADLILSFLKYSD